MLGVHPTGTGSGLPAKDVHVTFGPDAPDYGGIAKAAGGAWSAVLSDPKDTKKLLLEAIEAVKNGQCAVLDVHIEKF